MKKPTQANIREGRRKRGSTLILFTLMMPTLLIPLVGLGIDATMLYIVQAKLSAATDGAALGAGRLLGTLANPQEIAGEFLTANFPTDSTQGFWGAYNLTPNITYVAGITKTITVNATARVPLLFSRVFGQPSAQVAAMAVATRNDSRVVLVIDRSGSMNNSDGAGSTVIADAKSYASGFVQKFTEGSDEIGLVVFDISGVVGYPAGTWSPTISLASTGGPNKTFNDGSSTDVPHQIANITADSGTGMAEGLSLAYIELQKAHMRDLNADGVDTRLNSIVLLTDGVPSAVSLYFNNPANTNADNIVNGSTSGNSCTNKTITAAGANANNMMKGAYALSGPAYSGTTPFGVFLMATQDAAAHSAAWWMNFGGSSTAADYAAPNPTTPYAGCTGMYNNKPGNFNYVTKIPSADVWGNSLTTGGYVNSHILNGSATSVYTGTALNTSTANSEYQWGLAIWNSVDNAAKNARIDANLGTRVGDTSGNMNVAIYAIGYTGNGGSDDGLLKRVANDKSAVGYDATQRTGIYVTASDKVGLANAFNTIASAILRLAY